MIEKVRSDWNPNVPLGDEDHSGGVALIELYEAHQA
jgi:hypothetical protein